jgi:hypothetical protein
MAGHELGMAIAHVGGFVWDVPGRWRSLGVRLAQFRAVQQRDVVATGQAAD